MGNRLKKILEILKKTFGVFKKEKVAAFFAAVALTLKEKFTAFKESKFGHAVVSGLKAIGAKIAEYDDEEVIREKVDEITDKIFAAILAGPRYLLKKFKESKAGSAFLSGLKALQERVSARIACFSKDKVKEKAAAIFAAVLAALKKKHEAFKASKAGITLTAASDALKKKFKESKAGAALISVWQPLKEKRFRMFYQQCPHFLRISGLLSKRARYMPLCRQALNRSKRGWVPTKGAKLVLLLRPFLPR